MLEYTDTILNALALIKKIDYLCSHKKFVRIHVTKATNIAVDSASVSYSFNDVACSGLALCSKHRSTFGYATEGFSQISASADKRHFEVVLVNVILLVGHRQDLTFVNIIYLYGFQNLRLNEVTDADLTVKSISLSGLFKLAMSSESDEKYLCHYGDGDGRSNLVDHGWIAHACDTSVISDVCWNSL